MFWSISPGAPCHGSGCCCRCCCCLPWPRYWPAIGLMPQPGRWSCPQNWPGFSVLPMLSGSGAAATACRLSGDWPSGLACFCLPCRSPRRVRSHDCPCLHHRSIASRQGGRHWLQLRRDLRPSGDPIASDFRVSSRSGPGRTIAPGARDQRMALAGVACRRRYLCHHLCHRSGVRHAFRHEGPAASNKRWLPHIHKGVLKQATIKISHIRSATAPSRTHHEKARVAAGFTVRGTSMIKIVSDLPIEASGWFSPEPCAADWVLIPADHPDALRQALRSAQAERLS